MNQRQFSAGLLQFILEPQNFRKEKKRQKFSLVRKNKLLGSLKDKRKFLYPFIRCLVEYIKHVHNFLSLFSTQESGWKWAKKHESSYSCNKYKTFYAHLINTQAKQGFCTKYAEKAWWWWRFNIGTGFCARSQKGGCLRRFKFIGVILMNVGARSQMNRFGKVNTINWDR